MEFQCVSECFGVFPNAKVIKFSNEQFLYKKTFASQNKISSKGSLTPKKEAEDTCGILRYR